MVAGVKSPWGIAEIKKYSIPENITLDLISNRAEFNNLMSQFFYQLASLTPPIAPPSGFDQKMMLAFFGAIREANLFSFENITSTNGFRYLRCIHAALKSNTTWLATALIQSGLIVNASDIEVALNMKASTVMATIARQSRLTSAHVAKIVLYEYKNKSNTLIKLLLENNFISDDILRGVVTTLSVHGYKDEVQFFKSRIERSKPYILIGAFSFPQSLPPSFPMQKHDLVQAELLEKLVMRTVVLSEAFFTSLKNGWATTTLYCLCENRALLQLLQQSQQSLLFTLCKHKFTDVVKILLNAGLDPLPAQAEGLTLLHAAALYDMRELCKAILVRLFKGTAGRGDVAGEYLEKPNKEGITALGLAMESGHAEIACALTDSGASTYRVTDSGIKESALLVADQLGMPELTERMYKQIQLQELEDLNRWERDFIAL